LEFDLLIVPLPFVLDVELGASGHVDPVSGHLNPILSPLSRASASLRNFDTNSDVE
jgi:hypothetical protein